MNLGLCNTCRKIVPANPLDRDGKVFLVKNCSSCGPTETLISSDSRRYHDKQTLDLDSNHHGCALNCLHCRIEKKPNVVFVDLTNRCNLNCPICINNTPSMGFLFEPPIEYFDKIFKHFSTFNPRPFLQLFGGEPTVRKDLLDIIRLARSYKLQARLVTNGIALADEEYCRKLLKTRPIIYFAYDNDNPEVYRVFRGSAKALELKQKAIENIGKIGGAKVILMSLVAMGFNEKDLDRLVQFCHERRDFVRAIFFMPLTHNWHTKDLHIEPEHINTEDVENLVAELFPSESVEFLPAGFFGQLKTINKYLKIKPLPFGGAHPNCESMSILLSDGEKYVPLTHYLRGTMYSVACELRDAERRLAAAEVSMETSAFGRLLAKMHLKNTILQIRALASVLSIVVRHGRWGRLLKGSGLGKVKNGIMASLELLVGRKKVLTRRTTVQRELQLVVLPFEDKYTLETLRLERCPAVFAYVDPKDDQVKYVTACAWGMQKTAVMREIVEHYSGASPETVAASPASG